MAVPEGFDYAVRADGSVSISHRGRAVTACAAAFLAEAERGDPQEVMARWTGRYRRERTAKKPPAQRPSLTAAAGRE